MKKMNVGEYGRVIAHFDALGETNKIRNVANAPK